MSRKRSATIHDVAKLAGVSIKTVSRVVNNEPKVRAETARRVREAIAALDYVPNSSARSLRSERAPLIGLVHDNPSIGYISTILIGAHAACRRYDYHLVVEPIRADAPDLDEAIERLVVRSRISGLILTPPVCDDPRILATLERHDLPFAQIAPNIRAPGNCYVYMEDEQAAFELTRKLIELGHRRLAIILGDPNQIASTDRRRGFERALAEAGLPLPAEYVQQGDFTYRSGLRCAEALLTLPEPPSAIFASNDDMAIAAISVAHKHHLHVPDDVSIVGFDDIPYAAELWPALTTVRQPIAEMAAAAVELLLEHALPAHRQGETCRLVTRLDYTLQLRESAGPPRR
ncbi:MAG: LacI family transcriptional regulator [Gammaproteobacteria bacterium]|nr:MAG: LacI family transcriptional regulator [Gammaproteobacteria bacterium]